MGPGGPGVFSTMSTAGIAPLPGNEVFQNQRKSGQPRGDNRIAPDIINTIQSSHHALHALSPGIQLNAPNTIQSGMVDFKTGSASKKTRPFSAIVRNGTLVAPNQQIMQ